jgi:hypothetical protein
MQRRIPRGQVLDYPTTHASSLPNHQSRVNAPVHPSRGRNNPSTDICSSTPSVSVAAFDRVKDLAFRKLPGALPRHY